MAAGYIKDLLKSPSVNHFFNTFKMRGSPGDQIMDGDSLCAKTKTSLMLSGTELSKFTIPILILGLFRLG